MDQPTSTVSAKPLSKCCYSCGKALMFYERENGICLDCVDEAWRKKKADEPERK